MRNTQRQFMVFEPGVGRRLGGEYDDQPTAQELVAEEAYNKEQTRLDTLSQEEWLEEMFGGDEEIANAVMVTDPSEYVANGRS